MDARSLAIGVDIGGTTIKGGIVSADGTLIRRVNAVPTPLTGAEDVADAACALARELLDCASTLDGSAAYGDSDGIPVGIACPGIVDESRGIGVYSANLGWIDAPLKDLMTERMGRPVALGHDVRSGALAEAMWGVRLPSFFYVAIGTGIATGLVQSGRLWPAPPWSGEIGQVLVPHPDSIENPAPLVPVETIASAAGMVRRAVAQGLIAEEAGARGVQELAESDAPGAHAAMAIIRTSMQALGAVLATAAHTIGPLPLVIGGGVGKGGETIFAPLRDTLTELMPPLPVPDIFAAGLGADSQILGAAAIAFAATTPR